jgi:general secretion pathway protein G
MPSNKEPKMKVRTHRQRRGFTLIELIVVVLILAILAALIVPRVVGRSGDAKRSKAATDIATLSSLIQQYRLDTGRFPTTEEGLLALREAPADVENWKGPYMTKPIPPDPWGFDYIYEYPGAGGDESFILMSLGRDGAEGGEGEDADISEGLE